MRKTLLKHRKDIFRVFGLVAILAAIRGYQRVLFYDPFLDYFEQDYLTQPFPSYNTLSLYASLIFRYVLNTIVSLLILYVLFRNTSYVKLATIIYTASLLILLIAFACTIEFTTAENYQYLFYIRRFLIQPLLVLLLIPAFLYQKRYA